MTNCSPHSGQNTARSRIPTERTASSEVFLTSILKLSTGAADGAVCAGPKIGSTCQGAYPGLHVSRLQLRLGANFAHASKAPSEHLPKPAARSFRVVAGFVSAGSHLLPASRMRDQKLSDAMVGSL